MAANNSRVCKNISLKNVSKMINQFSHLFLPQTVMGQFFLRFSLLSVLFTFSSLLSSLFFLFSLSSSLLFCSLLCLLSSPFPSRLTSPLFSCSTFSYSFAFPSPSLLFPPPSVLFSRFSFLASLYPPVFCSYVKLER